MDIKFETLTVRTGSPKKKKHKTWQSILKK